MDPLDRVHSTLLLRIETCKVTLFSSKSIKALVRPKLGGDEVFVPGFVTT
jgi:hypothetical protein